MVLLNCWQMLSQRGRYMCNARQLSEAPHLEVVHAKVIRRVLWHRQLRCGVWEALWVAGIALNVLRGLHVSARERAGT